MTIHLRNILPRLLGELATAHTIAENPLPALWPVVADLLAGDAHREAAARGPDRQIRLHNGLLLTAFFLSCKLPQADFAERTLEGLAHGMNSIRGKLVRIVENLAEDGAKDAAPPLSPRTGALRLGCENLSSLLASTARESREIDNGNGSFHRVLTLNAPAEDAGGLSHGQIVQARDRVYRQYEHTVLAYMALACIEQLVRAWASARGIQVVKPGGRPVAVPRLLGALGVVGPAVTAIGDLYRESGSNLRNRIMHGGLLDVESKRPEVLLPLRDAERFPPARWNGRDEYAPENVSQACSEALERLDADLASAGAVPKQNDLRWTRDLWLTEEEIGLGEALANDFRGTSAFAWCKRIGDYLDVVVPSAKHFFMIGFRSWLGRPQPDGLVELLAMAMVFEAVYRSTVGLLGFDILQTSGSGEHVQYRMIDERQLASAPVLDALMESVPPADRARARQVVQLSIRIRDALAHGALTSFTPAVARGAGHLLVKSTQGLVDAGMHAMTRVAAYYRWQNIRRGAHGFALDDWLVAEEQVGGAVARWAADLRYRNLP